MSRLRTGMVTVAAVAVAAVAGLWAGQSGVVKIPPTLLAPQTARVSATGPVIYYRDAAGRPFYSLTSRNGDDGVPYVAVHAGEDISFDPKASDEVAAKDRKVLYYRNPMGLPDISMVPKKDSMGMDYIPVYEGEETDDASVKVAPGKIQRAGVETVVIAKRPFTRTIEAPGVVQLDEGRVAVVSPRFDGYVVSVGPVTTGTRVRKGDVLATVFGQEVLNQAARLLVERASGWTRGDEAFAPPGADRPGGLVGASRRLRNMGVPEEFIEEVRSKRAVPDTFVYRAPIDGFVLERNWSDGQGFKAGDVAFRIADQSLVWMMADVAEGDIGGIRPGQPVKVTTRAHPGRSFAGKVAVVYPTLMKETRTVRVRIELSNPDTALLPDMYGNVAIATGGDGVAPAAPASAIIDSGSRQVVLLDKGDGRYEPREVTTGRKGDGFVEVLDGVSAGDKVVANGNFLIDAESNLQAALKGFKAPSATEAGQ